MEKCIGDRRFTLNVTWTPTFRKQQLAGKGLSQRVQNHNQHRVARIEPIFWQYRPQYVKMQCDKKSLLAVVDVSKKRNLMVVGGYADNVVDLCWKDNADAKRQCLGRDTLCWLSNRAKLSSKVNQSCARSSKVHVERGTPPYHITIHSIGKLFLRQTRGWMKRACPDWSHEWRKLEVPSCPIWMVIYNQ